ncbi:MAG TPA: SpoIIE family protein phosphatase [Oryzihumus sp.]|nr:SpoIIE family protein phosphatase [Oryzihumus sp.]
MNDHAAADSSSRPLSESAHRYELALSAGRMGTWYWDAVHDRLEWDEQLMRVFGVAPGHFGGTFAAYLELLHPDDVDHTVATVEESLRSRQDHYVEHRVVHPDGSVHWISGTGRVLTDDEGEVVGMVGVGADITEQHAAHEAAIAAEAATAFAVSAAALAESRLALLGRVSAVVGRSLDVGTTMQQIADIVVEEQLADWCVVQLPGGEHGIDQVALAHRDPEMVAMARRVQEDYPPKLQDDAGLGKVLLTGAPELWPSIPAEALVEGAEDATHLELLESLQMTAAMIIPLAGLNEVLGAMTLIGTQGRSFDENDLKVATEVGARAGIALDNASLYADRDTVARALQRSLLPAVLPDVPGVDLAALHRPGSPTLGVGGDFYDAFRAGDDSWYLVVGDVCGKGVEAAALTGAVRYAVRTASALRTSPAEILTIVNNTLLREEWSGRFATLVVARLEIGSDAMWVTVSSAGHPAPLLRRVDSTVVGLATAGTIVGALPEATFEDARQALSRGDCLLLYTDGVTEAGAPHDLFGDDRLARAFSSAASQPAAAIAAEILEAVDAFRRDGRAPDAPPEYGDDMAVLVLRLT